MGMENVRRFPRYAVSSPDQVEVFLGGKAVRLVDFSLGGFYVVSDSKPPQGEIDISVKFQNSEKMDLVGRIVRVKRDGDMWGIAIDVSKNYNPDTLRKA